MAREAIADWAAIEKAVVSGMSFKQAENAFSVAYDTIRKRALRFEWPTALAVKRKAMQLRAEMKASSIVPIVSNADLTSKMAESWLRKAESHRELTFEMANKALQQAKPDVLKQWQDIERADKMARRASGLDSTESQQQVNVNLALVNSRLSAIDLPVDA